MEGSDLVKDPDSDAAANVRDARRAHDRAVKVPKKLVEELARVSTRAQQVWREARPKSDFAAFKPWLEQIVRLKREEAQAVGYKGVPYDALLDEYEPGATTAEITGVFAALRDELVPLLAAVTGSGRAPRRDVLHREYPVDRQKVFAYILSASFAALAGVILAGRLSSGSPTLASELLLPSIAAVVVGGTAITGGVGSIWRTLVGALIISVVRIGMTFLGVNIFAQNIVFGAVLIAAVAITIDRSKIPIVK